MRFKVTRIWHEVEADNIEAAIARTRPADVELQAASQHEHLAAERIYTPEELGSISLSHGDAELLTIKSGDVVQVRYGATVERVLIRYARRFSSAAGYCWGHQLSDDGEPDLESPVAYALPSGAELALSKVKIEHNVRATQRELTRAVLALQENPNHPHIVGVISRNNSEKGIAVNGDRP